MQNKKIILITLVGALTIFGAACSSKKTVTESNVNAVVNTVLNTANVNYNSTGDFSTTTNSNTSANTNTAPVAKTVTITAAGVSPKTLTVPVGTTVTFVNTDTIAHHVASNPHPTHTDLPGFDNLSASESYSFTFSTKGSFGYHDHLDPFNTAMQGTIVVQ